MIYVVTGCLGFIGRVFTEKLLQDGHYVIGIDAETYAADPNCLVNLDWLGTDEHPKQNEDEYWPSFQRFKYIKADIAELRELPDCDVLVNFAAETHVDNSIRAVEKFVHSNYQGVQNMLDIIRTKPEYERPRFVQISTDEVYGDTLNCKAPTETSFLNPSNPYAATKAAADLLIKAYARTYNIKYNIVRPSNCWGAGQYPEKLIPKSIRCLRLGRKIPIHGSGEQYRSWLYVEDAVSAIRAVIDKGTINEIYNIGGISRSIINIVNEIWTVFRLLVESSDTQFSDVYTLSGNGGRAGMDLWYFVNDDKIRNLPWTPSMTKEQMGVTLNGIIMDELDKPVIL